MPTTLIEGFQIDVPSDVIKARLQRGSAEFARLAAESEALIAKMRQVSQEDSDGTFRVRSETNKMRVRRARSDALAFMAEHVIPGVVYRISGRDLSNMGLDFGGPMFGFAAGE